MSLHRDEVHVESLIDIVIEQLVLESAESHILEFFRAHLVLLFWGKVLGGVSLNTGKYLIKVLEVFAVMLKMRIEVSLEGDSRALISWGSVSHVER